jgi:AcrR family transcriptional regulator
MAEPLATLSRRDRVRAATVQEIKRTARRVLVDSGADGLSLRAIARDMGMTAPALYRYFPSREELLEGLVADLYTELGDAMEAARDALPEEDVPGRLMAISRTFRQWSLDHPREFALLFGSPIEGFARPHKGEDDVAEGPAEDAGRRFGAIFGALVAQLYLTRPFPIPADDEIDDDLRPQLRDWCETFPVPLPLGVMQVFLSCWIRLYGAVSMEVFGHLKFAVRDAEPMFEAELHDIGGVLGIAREYRPPRRRAARATGRR